MTTHSQPMPIAELLQARLGVEVPEIAALCDRYSISEFGLFGSVLRDDFWMMGSDPSDVDALVVFAISRTLYSSRIDFPGDRLAQIIDCLNQTLATTLDLTVKLCCGR